MYFIENLKERIKHQWIAAFTGSFAIGFITYIYFIANHFGDADSLMFQYSAQNMITSGRPFLTYLAALSSYYDIQAFNDILALIFLGFTSAIIVEIFDIKHTISCVLIGGMLTIFPAISSTFAFHFVVDAYMLSVLMISVAFLLTDRYRFGFIPAIVLVGITLGVYQAYFSFLITLCILVMLVRLIDCTDIKTLLIKAAKYLAMGVGSFAFYYASLRLMLKLQGVSLSTYQGGDVLTNGGFDFLAGIRSAYHGIGRFLFVRGIVTVTAWMRVSIIVLFLAAAVMYIIMFSHNRQRLALRIMLTLILLGVLPIGMYIVSIMLPYVYFYNLMEYAWALIFSFVIVLADKICDEKYRIKINFKNIMTGISILFTVIMLFEFSKAANTIAFNLNELYEKSYGFCLRVVDRLEQTEDFNTTEKVVLLGGRPSEAYYSNTNITRYHFGYYEGAWESWNIGSHEEFYSICTHYLGIAFNRASNDEINDIIYSDAYIEMPVFPAKDSIQKIDDVWVIKIN